MRILVSLALGLVLCLPGCRFDEGQRPSSALGEAPPASPQLIDFASDFGRSWNPGMYRGMWRTDIDDVRNGGKIHIRTEAQCPDRYRILVTGAEQSEQIFISRTMYERRGDGAWSHRSMPMPHMMLNACGRNGPPPDDPARIRLLAEQFSGSQISGPEIREVNGHQCRDWTREIDESAKPIPLSMCYDLKNHAIVQTRFGQLVTTYDWESPVDIKPPI